MATPKIVYASRERWMEIAENCPYATYFHTPHWYELMLPKRNYTALEVFFNDGVSAIVIVAQIKRFGGLLIDCFSSPGGTYGGWISAFPLNDGHVKTLFDILTSKKNLTFRVNPFDKSLMSLLTSKTLPHSIVAIGDNHTHILDLTKGIDKLHCGMNRGHRNAINVAARNDVTVKQAETFDEWERYYRIYLDSVERWRNGKLKTRNIYPIALFKRLYENRTGNEILWLATKDGKPIAGVLFLYWGIHATAWHGAATAQYFHVKPNNLLYWEIIKDAINKGYEILDFNPSGGYGGVESFKKNFGATSTPSPMLLTRTPLRSLITWLHSPSSQ